MSCRRASTASATTAFSPAKPAPAISRVSANSSRCHSSPSTPSRPSTPSPRNQKHPSIRALLRQSNAHYRDVLARAAAKELPHTGSAKDQDRYLTIPSPSIRHSTDPLHAGSLSAGSAPACILAPDRPPAPPPIHSRNAQLAPASRSHAISLT